MNHFVGLQKRRIHPTVTSKDNTTCHEPAHRVVCCDAWSASLPTSPRVRIGQDFEATVLPSGGLESSIQSQSPVRMPSSLVGCRIKFGALFTPSQPIDPLGMPYIWWLVVMNICYIYNAWSVPLRATFQYQQPANTPWWMAIDALCDTLYLTDLALLKPRLMFMCNGFWVDDLLKTKKNYRRKLQFKMDALSLVPLEVMYLVWGAHGGGAALLRLPRLLRLQTFWDLHGTVDRVLSKAYSVRIGKTLTYIFYLIHVQACAYYTMSAYEGLGSNSWVYDGEGSAYIRCFYFATKTATSIGKNPKPEHEGQYIFMTIAWLIGVFVFALLLGQIRHIINMATRQQSECRYMLDQSLRYLRRLNLPEELQERVSSWFILTWKHQGCFDESRILASLPLSLRRALSLRVHGVAMAKSSLLSSAACERALLRELVLALRPIACLPGDVVCRRGDVGQEMYIVNSGQLLVIGANGRDVLATLREGSVFGEISLLGIPGANRRTATVRSRGYSQLFALSKCELEDVLQQYPAAQSAMHARAQSLMRINAHSGGA